MDCTVCDVDLNKVVISIKAVSVSLRKGYRVGCGMGFQYLMEGGIGLNSPLLMCLICQGNQSWRQKAGAASAQISGHIVPVYLTPPTTIPSD